MQDLRESVEHIFATALGLEPGKRAAYLDSVCRDSPAIKQRVEEMLKQDEQAGSFLQRPLIADAQLETIAGSPANSGNAISAVSASQASSAHTAQFAAGDVLLDRFAVVRFLAKGGMGEVYEVEDRRLHGVHLALKTILSQYAADSSMLARFEREVLNARGVVHPNLCPIYDIFHWDRPEGRLTFLTMKLLAGETLAARLARSGPIPDPEATQIIHQVGAGLAAAHNAGILHRDIKASNILLDGTGDSVYACVTDFGLARGALSETTGLTSTAVAGTPGYMAPELFYGAPPTKASDVYSFGVVAYQILSGEMPPMPSTRSSKTPIRVSIPNLPAPWTRFLDKCLAPEPAQRYAGIPEAVQHIPATAIAAQPPILRLTRRRAFGLGAAAAAGVAGAAWLEFPPLRYLLAPLPKPRYVSLMAWPVEGAPASLGTILDSISQRLARAEAYVKDLLVIKSTDLPSGGQLFDSPSKSQSLLGANLVLTASLTQDASTARLNLQLLDSASQRVLRRGEVSSSVSQIATLAQKAAQQAAMLLGIPDKDVQLTDPEELRNVSPEVFQAFSEAEQLFKEPNYAGLTQAIAKYQDALSLNDHFALGYAKLAMAYLWRYSQTRDSANLDLAASNAANALRYNPGSAFGLLSQAIVYLDQGKLADADNHFLEAAQADPGNPQVALYKASALIKTEKFAEAEKTYRQIISARPNYWLAYNDLGVLFTRQAKYEDAAKAFAAAGAAAPRVAMPMANLGETYLELGRREDARAALTDSLSRGENVDGYSGLGDIDFEDGKYNDALKMYASAAKLEPNNHLFQRDMGDCYAMLGNPAMVKQCYSRAAALLSAQLATNPNNRFDWTNLAFYHAKIGDNAAAESDIKRAEPLDANDVASRFLITQALTLMGKKKEALDMLLWCVDHGVSSAEVDLAIDLKDLSKDPRYLQHVKNRTLNGKASSG